MSLPTPARTTAIDHLNLTVNSFDETAAWYERVFGFSVVEKDMQDGEPWGVLRSESGEGSAMLCVYQSPGRDFLDRFALRDRKLHGLAHFALRIHDEAEWLKIVGHEEITVMYNGVIEWPHSKSWYICDPTGYEIEVVLWHDERVAFSPTKQASPY